MLRTVISLLLVGYLPGALGYRLPAGDRNARAALPSEERVFWYVVLSLACTSVIAFSLAALGAYSFERLLWSNGILCALLLVALRWNVRLGATRVAPTWTAALPAALAIAGFSINFYVEPAEFIIGGRDPGVYINEGVQIAQRGTLTTMDDVAASVPAESRDLFFVRQPDPSYYSSRFMGFFLLDPSSGAVVGQFPHLYPVWVAIGYGINGLTGTRYVSGFAAVLGLLSVYFLGVRVVGRGAAIAGAGLLALNVVQVWYSRYPSAEIVMQPLVFAGLLAYVRAQFDRDRFFSPVAALLLCLALFAHLTAALAIMAMMAAVIVEFVEGRRASLTFVVPLIAGSALAAAYLVTVLPPYFQIPLGFARNLEPTHIWLLTLLAAVFVALVAVTSRPAISKHVRAWLPVAVVALAWAGAAYAYFFRTAGGRLAPHDAYALRTFAAFYVTPVALSAALIGLVILSRRTATAGVSFLFVATAYAMFFFYKIKVVPQHFWASRRFLAVVLPSMLLMAGAAAFSTIPIPTRLKTARYAAGAILVGYLAWQYSVATSAILRHVEYAGVIPHVEKLAGRFGENDLIIFESRGSSDLHVMAMPLAYIYDRRVLVLASMTPDKTALRTFLESAQSRYDRVFFIGTSRTDLLSGTYTILPVASDRFLVPEYDTPMNGYPRMARLKQFDFGLYELKAAAAADAKSFTLDVGGDDDLFVRDFYIKEQMPGGVTFRWSGSDSVVEMVPLSLSDRTVTLWLHKGPRPANAAPAEVQVYLQNHLLGSATVNAGLAEYRFSIPADVAASVSRPPVSLRLVSRTWSPARLLGGSDTRELGVIVDRIEVR